MTLVDTSIWIDHLRSGDKKLAALLNDGEAAVHPFIIGELACGNLKNREEILSLLHALPHVEKTDDDELLFFIEQNKLMGLGIGLIDCHLLAACKLSHSKFRTKDKRLFEVAKQLNLADHA